MFSCLCYTGKETTSEVKPLHWKHRESCVLAWVETPDSSQKPDFWPQEDILTRMSSGCPAGNSIRNIWQKDIEVTFPYFFEKSCRREESWTEGNAECRKNWVTACSERQPTLGQSSSAIWRGCCQSPAKLAGAMESRQQGCELSILSKGELKVFLGPALVKSWKSCTVEQKGCKRGGRVLWQCCWGDAGALSRND